MPLPPQLVSLFRDRVRGELRLDYPLAPHTSYCVGGPADLAIFPADAEALIAAIRLTCEQDLPCHILGGGTNLLISDRGIRGVVLFSTPLSALTFDGPNAFAEAGTRSHDVAVAACSKGLSGAEFLYDLPGTVGGALFMNAKAFGSEMSTIALAARTVDRFGTLAERTLRMEDFGYKKSPFQTTSEVILGVFLNLFPDDPTAIQARIDSIRETRAAQHEFDFPSCGCVFKNDYRLGISAGKLIESIGLKQFQIGDAQISPYHANFILNRGHATATDILRVIAHIKKRVLAETGQCLECEVVLLGEWDE